jgi:DNA-binding NarL/FixJ family response regulator
MTSILPQLTPRELDVLIPLMAGKTNQEIAELLNINVGTVKRHLNHIYAKLGVSNRTEAAVAGRKMYPLLRPWAS